ncbi:MAG: ferredoxin reductase family protein [Candidatus Cloacimonetes bacterium]|nr:ferredoxin reductase family protein [Candidatus Cloacimonadota bacterium]
MGGNWYSLFHSYSLGIVFGIISWVLFCFTLLLACRVRFLEKIFGQDKLLVIHKTTAAFALLTALIHAFFKLQFSTEVSIQLITGAAGGLIIITLSVMSFMTMTRTKFEKFKFIRNLSDSFRKRISYSYMKFLHNGLPLAMCIILVHILISSATKELQLRSILIYATGLPVILLWVYHKFIRSFFAVRGNLVSVKTLSPSLFSVEMSFNKGLTIVPGQFAYFKIADSLLRKEEHPFTIASHPEEKTIELVIKKEGKWTRNLSALKPGVQVQISSIYGKFTFKNDRPMLWVAGGVGITPFLAKIRQMSLDGDDFRQPVVLFWSTTTFSEMPFKREFDDFASRTNSFTFIAINTREVGGKRITSDQITDHLNILKKHAGKNPSLWFCGPNSLKITVLIGAKQARLKSNYIHYENFSI